MASAAVIVKIIARVLGSINKVATTKIAKEKLKIKIPGGNPSLYITIKKVRYTNAKPSSC